MQKLIYPLSLLVLAVALFLIVNYPDSNRMNLIGGGLAATGFLLNIVGFYVIKGKPTKV